jgi:hypothetical protein
MRVMMMAVMNMKLHQSKITSSTGLRQEKLPMLLNLIFRLTRSRLQITQSGRLRTTKPLADHRTISPNWQLYAAEA